MKRYAEDVSVDMGYEGMINDKVIAEGNRRLRVVVQCIRHRNGWCATVTGNPFSSECFSVQTLCGHYVILPWGSDKRQPTCVECLEKLGERCLESLKEKRNENSSDPICD